MSYLVLARKWRPQGFQDLIGQESITRILTNAIEQGRIAHAYLFSGPRGVGKTSAARILAKAMNCEKGPTPVPCGTCPSCRGITDGSSVDVMEIDGASNNSVNDIRDLRDRVKYAPAEGRYKVYIIDEAHMLSDPAFNALLKTLEEPPPHVAFVLATTVPRKVPATVLSRCQHLPFKRITYQKLKERLKIITDAEKITISESAMEMIARASEGSMRDCLTILDQVSAFSSDITGEEVKDLLGIADFGALSELSRAVICGDRKKILMVVRELTDKGTDLRAFTKDLVAFFRDLLVAKVAQRSEEILDVSEHESHVISEINEMATEEQLTALLSELIKAEFDVRSAFSPRVALEMALVRSSFLSMLKSVSEAIRALDPHIQTVQEKNTSESVKHTASGKRPQTTERPLSSPEELPPSPPVRMSDTLTVNKDTVWSELMRRLDKVNHPLACKLSEAEATMDGDTISILFNGGSAIHADSVKSNISVLEKEAFELLGRKVSFTIDIMKKKPVRKKEIREKVISDPVVQEAIELFEGRIVDVRPSQTITNGGNDV